MTYIFDAVRHTKAEDIREVPYRMAAQRSPARRRRGETWPGFTHNWPAAVGEPYALEWLTLEFLKPILGPTRSRMKERYSGSDVSLRAAMNGLMSSVATYRN